MLKDTPIWYLGLPTFEVWLEANPLLGSKLYALDRAIVCVVVGVATLYQIIRSHAGAPTCILSLEDIQAVFNLAPPRTIMPVIRELFCLQVCGEEAYYRLRRTTASTEALALLKLFDGGFVTRLTSECCLPETCYFLPQAGRVPFAYESFLDFLEGLTGDTGNTRCPLYFSP